MIPVGTKIRVIAGPHTGLDGTVTEFAHDVYTISSWLTGEEFYALKANVVRLDDLPVDPPSVPPAHVASTRRALAAEIREVVEKMERLRGGLVSLAAHGEARVVWEAQQNLCSVAGRMGE